MPAADRFTDVPDAPDQAGRLVQLIRADPWIMDLLRAVRSLGLADWCVAAGVVRNKVWDHLHGHPDRTRPFDIDVLFFDRDRTDAGYEADVERRLSAIVPSVRWEAVNQATVHSYTKDPPYESIAEAMSRWADPVTAVGVRLTASDDITVLAPHGLADLFGLVVRPNLVAPDAARVYRERMTQKRWTDRWPRLTILWPEASAER
jgi:hypothetical protein